MTSKNILMDLVIFMTCVVYTTMSMVILDVYDIFTYTQANWARWVFFLLASPFVVYLFLRLIPIVFSLRSVKRDVSHAQKRVDILSKKINHNYPDDDGGGNMAA